MNIKDILLQGGGLLAIVLTFIQIAPIKVNPWTALAAWIGKAFGEEMLKEIESVKEDVKTTRQVLDEHIRMDDERNADSHRQRILQFNNELLRDIPHTKEDFIEILSVIDFYEDYCEKHPEDKNNRAVHALAHIGKVYDERLEKHDFL